MFISVLVLPAFIASKTCRIGLKFKFIDLKMHNLYINLIQAILMKHYFYIFLAIKLQVYLMCHFVRRETRHLVSVREREREREVM